MNNEILREIITTPMPYGKYKGTIIADLPVYYWNGSVRKVSPRESSVCSSLLSLR